MRERRSDYDVMNSVQTTNPFAVSDAVCGIYRELYQRTDATALARSFRDIVRLYSGSLNGYDACDTGYHDLQHVLDVTLAMARLLDGYERAGGPEPLGERLFRFGILLALFHDSGYLRYRKDTRHRLGAEYTLVHVSRSARLLENYLPQVEMADLIPAAVRTVHFSGYEIPAERIRVPAAVFREIGNLLGTADILAQMADRCYLEKVYDRLYPEFVLGGVARRIGDDGREEVMFASAADLIAKTPQYYVTAMARLNEQLHGAHRYAQAHFRGDNPYLDAIDGNIAYVRLIGREHDMAGLRRQPPRVVITPDQMSLL